MKILILGSCGFIGHHLCEYLYKKNNEIVGCDIVAFGESNYKYYQTSILFNDFEDIFSNNNFDICINASGSANVAISLSQPISDFEANVYGVARVLDAIRRHQPRCKYLHISSAAVYGNPQHLPIDENAFCFPISPYGYHKWMSELLCKEYFSIYGIKTVIVRPFSVFGEGLRKQLLWDLCNKCKTQKELLLFGTGMETRDFIHISDLCRSIELILVSSTFNFDLYNLANGKSIQIKEIAEGISLNFPNTIIRFNNQQKEGDPIHWQSDISRIKALGYNQQVSLDKGLSDYVNWFLKIVND
jgi:nucleoside-diphosphate-sugar epimerase